MITNKQIEELKKCCIDPKYFIENYCYIQHPVKGNVKLEMYDYQKNYVDCMHNNKMVTALMSRQLGKTAVSIAYLLWYSMFKNNQNMLVCSKSGLDAMELSNKFMFMYDYLPDFLQVNLTTNNKRNKELDNGNRIMFSTTTENTGRGFSVNFLLVDEFAFVKADTAHYFWSSILPTLSLSSSKCIVTSTAYKDNHVFKTMWDTALYSSNQGAFYADWHDHPDRDAAWATIEQKMIGKERFEMEHENKFIKV